MPLTIRGVCGTCNGTWLSELEGIVQPILTPLILGMRATLSFEDQLAIGVWITKTVMLLEQTGSFGTEIFFTPAERRSMCTDRWLQPPKRAVIWLGQYCGTSVSITEVESLRLRYRRTPTDIVGSIVTFAIGSLAGQMLCHRAGEGLHDPHIVQLPMRPGPWDETLFPIWPARDEEIAWPPRIVVDDRGIRMLRERWHVPLLSPFEFQQRIEEGLRLYGKTSG